MSKKSFFFGILLILMTCMVGELLLSYWIDPIGIWGAPVIRGFNHYKFKQIKYMDVFHPYEYFREKPDVLYIGTSQINRGFAPICRAYPKERAYTMGYAGLSLSHLREYLRFVYKVHKPKVIYVGLTPGMLTEKRYYITKDGYSEDRLRHLSGSAFERRAQILEDSLRLHEMFWSTIKESRSHFNEDEPFFHGWYAASDAAHEMGAKRYYSILSAIIPRCAELGEVSAKATECLRDIAREAKEVDVNMVVCFPPIDASAHVVLHVTGYWPAYLELKRTVAEIMPVYDFVTMNEWAASREWFVDPTHFRSPLGEKIKPILEGTANPAHYGYLLTPETVETAFEEQNIAWEKWQEKNKGYVKALAECIEAGRKPKEGDFAQFIGF